MTFRVVIPARFGSSRLPGKPLADIGGKPMIVRVAEAAARSSATAVIVATDDERILEVVLRAGFQCRMTRDDHPSGSDRVMEIADAEGWPDDGIVINVQGDEPLLPAAVLDQLAATLQAKPELGSATLREPISRSADLLDPNLVKVVFGSDDRALYFSRAPIPFDRDQFANMSELLPQPQCWWRHVGVYGYRVWALRRFVGLPPGSLEQRERLEQLRMLENGLPMQVVEACEPVPGGVDTQQDLERVRTLLGGC